MNDRRWTVLGTALLAGCGAPAETGGDEGREAQEVVRGVPDHGRHPAVVALLVGRDALCSGTLVSPRAVLTARHCVSFVTEQIDCTDRRPQVLGDRDPRTITVITGDDVRSGTPAARGLRFITPTGNRLCGADVAVLVLDRDVTGIAPLAVARRPAAAPGATVAIAGFGRRSDAPDAPAGVRYYRVRVRVLGASETEFVTADGSCSGDSGGPAIDVRTGQVVGVVSRGGERCLTGAADSYWSHASLAAPLLAQLR